MKNKHNIELLITPKKYLFTSESFIDLINKHRRDEDYITIIQGSKGGGMSYMALTMGKLIGLSVESIFDKEKGEGK